MKPMETNIHSLSMAHSERGEISLLNAGFVFADNLGWWWWRASRGGGYGGVDS
jgi:hypothetical protein